MSRRQAVLAAALTFAPFQAAADAASSRSVMLPTIRPATRHDLTGIVALLMQDAEQRRSSDRLPWPPVVDAPVRIGKAVDAVINGASAGELWFVADQAGRIVGVAHAMMVPVPPIYDGAAGPPGLSLGERRTPA